LEKVITASALLWLAIINTYGENFSDAKPSNILINFLKIYF